MILLRTGFNENWSSFKSNETLLTAFIAVSSYSNMSALFGGRTYQRRTKDSNVT
jgi:hypothetical protein